MISVCVVKTCQTREDTFEPCTYAMHSFHIRCKVCHVLSWNKSNNLAQESRRLGPSTKDALRCAIHIVEWTRRCTLEGILSRF